MKDRFVTMINNPELSYALLDNLPRIDSWNNTEELIERIQGFCSSEHLLGNNIGEE